MNDKEFFEEIEAIIGMILEVIETHMSIIYVGNDLVAKLIKPVDLGFVNLRPIEKRRDAAEKTAQIDSAYCKDLHSRVVEINGIPMIIMRRFNSSDGFDEFYRKGKVTTDHAKQIGSLFAEAHKNARTDDQISQIGYEMISANWEGLFFVTKDVAKTIGRTISQEDYDKVMERIRSFILENNDYFENRRDNGFIRQTHGDGHAGNMFVEDGKVKIFDGIGFNDGFSFADVIADIAFPIMDAITRGRKDIAEEIVRSYLCESHDTEGIQRLLGFYICYRAFVRGQVSTMIADTKSGEEQKELLQEAKRYYDLAVEYLPN